LRTRFRGTPTGYGGRCDDRAITDPLGPGAGPVLEIPSSDLERRVLEVVAAPGPTGGGGSFFVDPERAEDCIRALRGVAVDLVAMEPLLDLTFFPPPSADVVSVNSALQAGVMARRAGVFVAAWRVQLQDTVDGLEQQLAQYRGADEKSRARLT
jgi:hypothetical protein